MLTRLREGHVATAEIKSLRLGHKAWIGVYPLHEYAHLESKGRYRIRVFEVEEDLLRNENDIWEGNMEKRADVYVHSDGELLEEVAKFVEPSQLVHPVDSGYPV